MLNSNNNNGCRKPNVLLLLLFQDDIRCDGRHCKDYRPMELETEFLPNTGGSARVRIVRAQLIKDDTLHSFKKSAFCLKTS